MKPNMVIKSIEIDNESWFRVDELQKFVLQQSTKAPWPKKSEELGVQLDTQPLEIWAARLSTRSVFF